MMKKKESINLTVQSVIMFVPERSEVTFSVVFFGINFPFPMTHDSLIHRHRSLPRICLR